MSRARHQVQGNSRVYLRLQQTSLSPPDSGRPMTFLVREDAEVAFRFSCTFRSARKLSVKSALFE